MNWRTILLAGSSIALLWSAGCNEDPVGGAFTFDAGQNDTDVPSTAEEWFETACETTSPGDVTVEENADGNWAFALPKGDFDYFNLPISGFDAPHAGALIDHSEMNLAGAIASGPGSIDDFQEPDKTLRRAILDRLPDGIEASDFGGNLSPEFETHDGRRARTLTSPLLTDSTTVAGQLRNDILFALTEFDDSDIWFVEPEFDGTEFSSFRLRLTLQSMPGAGDQDDHWVIAFSVEPTEPNDEQARIAAEDIAGSHNLAVAGRSFSAQCDRSTMRLPTPYYLYFVIDVDGPAGWADTVETYVTQISERIAQISSGDFRLQIGITNTIVANEGRFFRDTGWLERGELSADAVRRVATVCQESNDWQCDGERDGLAVAEAGLNRMDRLESAGGEGPRMKPHDERGLAVIFISDENPESVQNGTRTPASYRESLESHSPWVVQVIGPQSACGSKPLAKAYRGIDADSVEDLCTLPNDAGGLNRIVQEVFDVWASSGPSNFGTLTLSEMPISPSLRMFQNAAEITRDDAGGFRYQPDFNQVELRGAFSPWQVDYFGGPYFNLVRYYAWD